MCPDGKAGGLRREDARPPMKSLPPQAGVLVLAPPNGDSSLAILTPPAGKDFLKTEGYLNGTRMKGFAVRGFTHLG